MTTFIRVLNIILVTALTVFVGLVSAIFFIGSDETYARLLQTLPFSFARRMLGGVCVGFIGAGLILLINYLLLKGALLDELINFRKLFWGTVLLTTLASLIGTAIFFSH